MRAAERRAIPYRITCTDHLSAWVYWVGAGGGVGVPVPNSTAVLGRTCSASGQYTTRYLQPYPTVNLQLYQ